MNKNHLFKSVFLGMLVFSMINFVACKSYEKDIDELKEKTSSLEGSVSDLKKNLDGKFVKDVEKTKDGIKVVFSKGDPLVIKGGEATVGNFEIKADGHLYYGEKNLGKVKGEDGAAGGAGAAGAAGSKVTIDKNNEILIDNVKTGLYKGGSFVVKEKDGSYTINIYDPASKASVKVNVPTASYAVNNIALQGHTLNENGAKEVWFPIIVTDSINKGFVRIGATDFADAVGKNNYKNFNNLYAGKTELLMTVSPGGIQPEAFEVVGLFTNHRGKTKDGKYDDRTASVISNYNTYSRNDDECMLFNWGQAHYDGKFINKANLFHYLASVDGIRPYGTFDETKLLPLTPAKKDAKGNTVSVLAMRAKAWALAERTDNKLRTQVEMNVKSGDATFTTESYVARRHSIMQKNLFITGTKPVTFAAPTQFAFVEKDNFTNPKKEGAMLVRNTDPYFRNSWNENNGKNLMPTTTAEINKIDAREENKYYAKLPTMFNIPLLAADGKSPGTLNLKEHIRAYYYPSDAAGKTDVNTMVCIADKGAPKESIVDPITGLKVHNPFDDHTFEYELVDFYSVGVNHTVRYIDPVKSKDGIITIREKTLIDADSKLNGELHTAAIGRTPVIRVKMIAPGEDNKSVVKTAIVKLLITDKPVATVKDIEVGMKAKFELKSINQDKVLDMDPIFNHKELQLSKEQFKKHYKLTAIPTTVAFAHAGKVTPVHAHNYVLAGVKYNREVLVLDDSADDPIKINRLVARISPLAFEGVYTVNHVYTLLKPEENKHLPKNIKVKVDITVTYPKVVGPQKSGLNWQVIEGAKAADKKVIVASGRIGKKDGLYLPPVEGDLSYEMAQTLNTSFKIQEFESSLASVAIAQHAKYATAYKAYTEKYKFDTNFMPRPTLSYELFKTNNADKLNAHNTASNVVPNVEGLQLIKRIEHHGPEASASAKASHWDLILEPNAKGRAHIVRTKFNHTNGKYDYIEPAKKLITLRGFISFNEWIDANYGNYGTAKVKFSKEEFAKTNIWIPGVTAPAKEYEIDPFDKINGEVNYTKVVTDYTKVAPSYGRSAVIEEFQTIFAEPVRIRPNETNQLVDKFQDANNENKLVLDTAFVLTDYLYTDAKFGPNVLAGKEKHIIYNYKYANTKVGASKVQFTNGWNLPYATEFEADTNLKFEIGEAYYADKVEEKLDLTNKERFRLEYGEVAGFTGKVNYLTWNNAGPDISKTVIVEVKVSLIHKWGAEELTPAIPLTFDKGTKARSTFILPVKLVPHK